MHCYEPLSLLSVSLALVQVYVAACREAAAAGAAPPPLSVGFTYELCAGIVDKAGLDLAQIAKEEIWEECGFDVPLASIRLVTSYITAIGISGARQSIFAAEVDEGMATAAAAGGLRSVAGRRKKHGVPGGWASHRPGVWCRVFSRGFASVPLTAGTCRVWPLALQRPRRGDRGPGAADGQPPGLFV